MRNVVNRRPPGRKKNGEGGSAVECGTVKAPHAIAERVGLIETTNRTIPKRNGLPVDELAFTMAARRVLDPRARFTIPEWYQRTFLPEILGINLPLENVYQALTRYQDYLTDEVQADIEATLAARVMKRSHQGRFEARDVSMSTRRA